MYYMVVELNLHIGSEFSINLPKHCFSGFAKSLTNVFNMKLLNWYLKNAFLSYGCSSKALTIEFIVQT